MHDDRYEINYHYNYHEDINKSHREHFFLITLDQAVESIKMQMGEYRLQRYKFRN